MFTTELIGSSERNAKAFVTELTESTEMPLRDSHDRFL